MSIQGGASIERPGDSDLEPKHIAAFEAAREDNRPHAGKTCVHAVSNDTRTCQICDEPSADENVDSTSIPSSHPEAIAHAIDQRHGLSAVVCNSGKGFSQHLEAHESYLPQNGEGLDARSAEFVCNVSQSIDLSQETLPPSNGTHDTLAPTIYESNNDLLSPSPRQSPRFAKEDSNVARLPTVVAWGSPLESFQQPSHAPQTAISEITDLGDSGFYQSLRADNQRRPLTANKINSQEGLNLADQILRARVKTYEEVKGFLPRLVLSTLITEEAVYTELTRRLKGVHNANQIRDYARRVCEERQLPSEDEDERPSKVKSFKKIFAILVLIERTPSIIKFLEEDINDVDLPLVNYYRADDLSNVDLRPLRRQHQTLECFRDWTQYQMISFEDWQWTTMSPFFYKSYGRDVLHMELQGSVILPFTFDGRRDKHNDSRHEYEGGFGSVFKVDIHPEHHNFNLPETQCFAVKRLHSANKDAFKNEVTMLKMFCNEAHHHLISLLATYEQFGVYFLIFPWADNDLSRYWSTVKPNPQFDLDSVLWFAKQCEGLAHGLLKIHRYRTSNSKLDTDSHELRYGRHLDLKPENILWFNNAHGGTLKISDFGISSYSTDHSRSQIRRSTVAASMSYRAPESDIPGSAIGPSYDIWTLGCLYLEFTAWLLGGWSLVQRLAIERSSIDPKWGNMETDAFFQLHYCQGLGSQFELIAVVKPEVTESMALLHSHPLCSDFLHDMIDMVQQDMLLVKSDNPLERSRLSCLEIHHKLADNLRKCQDDCHYACKPRPRSTNPLPRSQAVEQNFTNAMVDLQLECLFGVSAHMPQAMQL